MWDHIVLKDSAGAGQCAGVPHWSPLSLLCSVCLNALMWKVAGLALFQDWTLLNRVYFVNW